MPFTSEIYSKPYSQEVSESVVQLTNPIQCKSTGVFMGDLYQALKDSVKTHEFSKCTGFASPECNWEVTEAADNSLHQSNFQVVNHKIKSTVVSIIIYYWNLWFATVSCYLRTYRGMLRLVNSQSTTNLAKIHRGDHGSGRQPLTSSQHSSC